MADTTYNGWTNYETWNVALWYDNDQGSYNERCDMVREIAEDNDDKDDAVGDIASWLKENVENANPLASEASMFSDILGAALGEVNWHEIAGNWLDEIWDEIVESRKTTELAEAEDD